MSRLLNIINRKLSLKLSIGITLLLVVVFLVSLGILFLVSRKMVKEEALERAELEVENMVQRVDGMMNEVEKATTTAVWYLENKQLHPDSLLSYSRRIVEMNPNFDGCSISMEPYFFPQKGRYFSAYSFHLGDSVKVKEEDPYEYFDKVYYKTPATLGKPSWVEAYSEYVDGTVSQNYEDLIVSYGVPLFNSKHEVIGVMSIDLSMPWISEVISGFKPYESSYCAMLGADGQYLIHPDTAKLMKKTIFTAADVQKNQDLIALGHDMIAGNDGMMTVTINGKRCIALYRSVQRAPWSLALIIHENEIMAGYIKLLYVLVPVLVFGLLIILAFCMNVITHVVSPIKELTEKLSYITNGHYNEPIEVSERNDVIGRLQNSFAEMQTKLSSQISNLQEMNSATEQMNKALEEASEQARKADEKKSEFLMDITHQLRTPLNIINGFIQVLRDDNESIPKEEVEEIVNTMRTNSISINRMVNMLLVSANSDKNVRIKVNEVVNICELVKTLTAIHSATPPNIVPFITEVGVPDTFTVKSNREFLVKILLELMYNAKKFTTEGYIKLKIRAEELKLIFEVEDTGPGVDESMREKLFASFEKGDIFSEGLGLGLPVCRQMIRMIGGDLKYDATYTRGSRFVMVIPNDGV